MNITSYISVEGEGTLRMASGESGGDTLIFVENGSKVEIRSGNYEGNIEMDEGPSLNNSLTCR